MSPRYKGKPSRNLHRGHSLEVGLFQSPDGWDLRVGWMAFSCQRAPLVRVLGELGHIEVIEVGSGPDIGLEVPGGCAAAAVWHAVDLRTDAAFDDVLVVALSDSRRLVADWAVRRDVTPPEGVTLSYSGTVGAPAGWDRRVVWAAGPCQLRPALTVHPESVDTPSSIRGVTARPGPHLADSDCPDEGVWHAVDLKLAEGPNQRFWFMHDPASG